MQACLYNIRLAYLFLISADNYRHIITAHTQHYTINSLDDLVRDKFRYNPMES